MAENYALNYGKAISMQGEPKMATQIALQRERLDQERRAKEQAREDAMQAQKAKEANDQFKVLTEEITIKDPTKYHKWYLPEVLERKRQVLERAGRLKASGNMNVANVMRDEIDNYLKFASAAQQESAKRFEEMKADEGKVAMSKEWRDLLNTGTLDDAIAFQRAAGGYRGVQGGQDPNTGIYQFGVQAAPRRDITQPFTEFSDKKFIDKNYDINLSKKPNAISNGIMYYDNDQAVPREQQVKGLKDALLQDKDYLFNMMIDTPIEEIEGGSFNPNDPKSVEDYLKTKMDNMAAQHIQNMKMPTRTERAPKPVKPAGGLNIGFGSGGTFTGNEYIATPRYNKNGDVEVFIDPVRGTAEELRVGKWKAKDGTVFDGVLGSYVHDSNTGDVKAVKVFKTGKEIDMALENLKEEYLRIASNLPDKYRDENTGEIKPVPVDAQGNKQLTPAHRNNLVAKRNKILAKSKEVEVDIPDNLSKLNSTYLEGKTDTKKVFENFVANNPKPSNVAPSKVSAPASGNTAFTKKQDAALKAFEKQFGRIPSDTEKEKILIKFK